MRADLHVHSNASDGTDDPATVMQRAVAAGLDVVALTDHDTTAGHAAARADLLPGSLILLPGMELSSELAGRSVHLLTYLFDPTYPELAAETQRIRDDRIVRAQEMVRLLNELGAPVSWEQVTAIAGDAVVGRPHIARAMVQAGVVAEPADAFTEDWIADDGRAYVRKYALAPARAISLVRAAGGVTVLAHPRAGRDWELSDEQIASLAAAGLAGVEVWHPDHNPEERTALLALVSDLGLIPTGGSDDHGQLTGYSIGSQLAAPDSYDRLLAAANPSA